jgi:hypothetical protein
LDEAAVIFLAMFDSCHHSGDSDGRCADVAEKLAQLFGWRQTYKVEKLQRSLADSVARRNLLLQQQQQQLLQSRHVADTVRNRKVSDSSYSPTVFRGTKGMMIMTTTMMMMIIIIILIMCHVWDTGVVNTCCLWETLGKETTWNTYA